ncbi:MAG: CBS domain-containing protein [Phenylobacterium sp.]|jgi:CBS domain-containing protein
MESIKVADYMNKRPVTFKIDMTVAEAVERLLHSHQIGGPVIDSHKHVVGFLSEQDCLAHMLEATYLGESHCTVYELMHKEPLTVTPNDSVLDLAQQMRGAKPKLYPVTDDEGRLVGIITRSDVLKAIDVQLHAMYEKGHTRLV